jgi:endonuclease YncB( thermonuclease family)
MLTRRSVQPVLLASIPFLLLAAASWPLSRVFRGKVVGVTDGDTLTVLVNQSAVKLRLYGVDCPEKRQPYGMAAKKFTAGLAFGSEVTFTVSARDRNGRYIANVTLRDGRNLSQEIVQSGSGWWFRRYAPKDVALRRLEDEARRARRGLWADSHPIEPWVWRKSSR